MPCIISNQVAAYCNESSGECDVCKGDVTISDEGGFDVVICDECGFKVWADGDAY